MKKIFHNCDKEGCDWKTGKLQRHFIIFHKDGTHTHLVKDGVMSSSKQIKKIKVHPKSIKIIMVY